ncbi:MAG: hypothetical protein ACE5PM_02610 [Candidatus Hydrothermarchaeales archaeon]
MGALREYIITLFLCILGIYFDLLALRITLSPRIVGLLYYGFFVVQLLLGAYLVLMAILTLQAIWVEWRWQPTRLR